MKNFLGISGLIVLIILTYSCKKDKPAPPVIVTNAVTEISYTNATSGGELTSQGTSPVLSMGICWDIHPEPLVDNNKTTEKVGLGVFTSNITQLNPNTLYYVRAYATNNAGTEYGNQVSFTTSQVAVPALTTTEISSITQTTAITGGNITTENGGSVTARGVCWNTATNPTIDGSKTTDGTGLGSFVSNISGLNLNTKYYVRAYATNISGTAYGNETSFTTSPSLVPTLTTRAASEITHNHAFIGGIIVTDGGSPTTSRGVCWSTSPNPTTNDSKTSDYFGLSLGFFPSFVSGLNPNTTYYVRAYATNSSGTGYGQQVQYVTLTNYTGQTGTINDNDGNSYQTIGIGSQIWMAENLKTTKFNDGVAIQNVTGDAEWAALSTSAYCVYNNDLNKKATYGVLYNWHTLDVAANGNRNVCPTSWHVPSVEEWKTLTNYLGEKVSGVWSMTTITAGANIAGTMLKEMGTAHWIASNTGTNATGFTALPGGFRQPSGFFNELGQTGVWWASTQLNYGNKDAYSNFIFNNNSILASDNTINRSYGASIRCIKD